ncbi:hypothetical protein [Helicobacter pylori]|uniref:hypothetical protein n=1 Tax=Helicobacter pylori TaxID=210 RepID=UPI0009A27172|nr:hypothetical protein [Helicobacter pylori]OPG54709.1 hypothetical protein BGL82_07075 [Helicobacter pylori]
MKIKAIMLGLAVSNEILFCYDFGLHSYTDSNGVKQYQFGVGSIDDKLMYIDGLDIENFNFSNTKNGRDLFKMLITNTDNDTILLNKVLRDEADAHITQREVSALQLEVMRVKKELVQLKQQLKQAKH